MQRNPDSIQIIIQASMASWIPSRGIKGDLHNLIKDFGEPCIAHLGLGLTKFS